MIVVGLMFSMFASYSKHSFTNKQRHKTMDHIEKIENAIAVHLKLYRQLPCPASLSVPPEDEKYGQAMDCENIRKFPKKTQNDYILSEPEEKRDYKEDKVITGRIPFKSLGLPQNQSLDAWDSDLYYAVSINLTDSNDYKQTDGVIDIIDEFGNTLIYGDSGVQYIIWSGGDDRQNMVNNDCRRSEDLDAENCDKDGTFRSMGYSMGEQQYDDLLSYKTSISKPDVVDGVCDLVEHLAPSVKNIETIIEQENLRQQSFYMQPGELVFMCNPKILRQLHEETCALFICRWDYTISHVETIR